MKIGKIHSQPTFDTTSGVRVFNGIEVNAEYVSESGRFGKLSFHYAYATNNYQGLVERVLARILQNKVLPTDITNVKNV